MRHIEISFSALPLRDPILLRIDDQVPLIFRVDAERPYSVSNWRSAPSIFPRCRSGTSHIFSQSVFASLILNLLSFRTRLIILFRFILSDSVFTSSLRFGACLRPLHHSFIQTMIIKFPYRYRGHGKFLQQQQERLGWSFNLIAAGSQIIVQASLLDEWRQS
jgi:hypothetical protein